MRFSVRMVGMDRVQRIIEKQIRAFVSFSGPLERIALDFYRLETEWFHSEGGGRWKPLSPAYAAWKKQYYPGKRLLRRTDRMYREFTGRPGNYRINRSSMSLYINGDYWLEHEYGDRKNRLPKRPVINPVINSKGQMESWHQLITKHILDSL